MYFEIRFHIIFKLFDGNLVLYTMPRCFLRSVRALNDTFIHEAGSFSPESKSIFVFSIIMKLFCQLKEHQSFR